MSPHQSQSQNSVFVYSTDKLKSFQYHSAIFQILAASENIVFTHKYNQTKEHMQSVNISLAAVNSKKNIKICTQTQSRRLLKRELFETHSEKRSDV